MKKYYPKPYTKLWKKAKLLTEAKNLDAIPLLEKLIIFAAEATIKGEKEIEEVPIDLWKDRCWLSIESLGVMPEYFEDEWSL